MIDFEKLGIFYLGKIIQANAKDDYLLLESKNLTTHAVCLGMTGSGKTGLGITIIEEAAIDKIPSIVIDPKGDLSNLMLTFPDLSPEEFLPWIDQAEAERKGVTTEAYAKETATKWKNGLSEWGEGPDRIKNLRNSVDMTIYTPASNAGIPLSVLSSFEAPPKDQLLDTSGLRDRILSTTSSILGLIGIDADPIKSREHIFISNIISDAWNQGKNVDIALLIQQVQKPPFDKIGALDVNTFFPEKDRMALSISLNNLLASPGFHAWMEGEPLNIQNLLYTKEGKPRVAIISVAHLSDAERMFFITLLLNQFLSWMRRQPGTSSLRALLYMDEIFGFFPPTAMPPSKTPMLTLLKQARAFGVGIVLATQNPVDLDYKGLANCGTWFIGKLQTERDKSRVLEGLNTASNGEFDSTTLNNMLASTGNRTFIMRSIYEKNPILFQTRWTLSYLRGPLTLAQISKLVDKPKEQPILQTNPVSTATPNLANNKPVINAGIDEVFINSKLSPATIYRPYVIGIVKLHYVDSKRNVDIWKDLSILVKMDNNSTSVDWDNGKIVANDSFVIEKEPSQNFTFESLPGPLMNEKNYPNFKKSLNTWLYQNSTYKIIEIPELKLQANPGETEAEFRIRASMIFREKRDEAIKKLQDNYAAKIAKVSEKIKQAQAKLSNQQTKSGLQKAETILSFGATILGALLGRGVTKGTISSAGTSMRRAGKITQENQATQNAEEEYKNYQLQLNDLQEQLRKEIEQVPPLKDPRAIDIESVPVRPRKSDISIEKVALAWVSGI